MGRDERRRRFGDGSRALERNVILASAGGQLLFHVLSMYGGNALRLAVPVEGRRVQRAYPVKDAANRTGGANSPIGSTQTSYVLLSPFKNVLIQQELVWSPVATPTA